MRRVLTALALLAVALVWAAPPAAACSCAGLGEAEAFERADVVFVGELVGYEEPTGEIRSSADPATWTFAVSEVRKGEAETVQAVRSEWMGASCGLESPRAGEYLVFASRTGSHQLPVGDGELYAGLCDGTRLLTVGAPAMQPTPTSAPPPGEPPPWAPYAVLGVTVAGVGALVALSRTRTGEPT